MQAVIIEATEEVENMGGVFRVPVLRRGQHSCDLIMTRTEAAMLIERLMQRMQEDDGRECNVVAWTGSPGGKRGQR